MQNSNSTNNNEQGVILTTKAGDGDDYDFYTRYYAPWIGVKEDPVCGK